MTGLHEELIKKTLVLVLFSVLLYATFLVTNSLSVMADAIYSLVDSLFVFSLWVSLVLLKRGIKEVKLPVKLISLSVTILSFLLVVSSAFVLYTSFLALKVDHGVRNPELLVSSELLFIFVLFYVYLSFREEALKEDVRALIALSKDVERNILASFLVILVGLFSWIGLHLLDPVVAILISSYVLYKSLLISFRSFKSFLGISDPVLRDSVIQIVRGTGARIESVEVLGVGPYFYVDVVVRTDHLPDPWEKVEEVIRRRIEAVVPSSVKVFIRHPGGGI